MTNLDPTEANAQIWASYLSREWDGWLRTTKLDSVSLVERTGGLVAALVAPWLDLLTYSPLMPVPEAE